MVLQVQRMQVQIWQAHFMGCSSFVVGKDVGGGGILHLANLAALDWVAAVFPHLRSELWGTRFCGFRLVGEGEGDEGVA
jgi:hypothetical protein